VNSPSSGKVKAWQPVQQCVYSCVCTYHSFRKVKQEHEGFHHHKRLSRLHSCAQLPPLSLLMRAAYASHTILLIWWRNRSCTLTDTAAGHDNSSTTAIDLVTQQPTGSASDGTVCCSFCTYWCPFDSHNLWRRYR